MLAGVPLAAAAAALLLLPLLAGGAHGARAGDACSSFELKALRGLYGSASGEQWHQRNGWDALASGATDACCSVFGIKCDANGFVYALELGANNLQGTLPSAMFGLSHLQFLYLSNNQLRGTLPRDLIVGNGNLQEFGVDGNMLTGGIPECVTNATRLQKLFVQDNQLSGSLAAVARLSELQYFYASNNQFSGVLPESFADLRQLQQIGVDNNRLSGALPAFGKYQFQLQAMWGQQNAFNGSAFETLEVIASRTKQQCSLAGNNFKCPVPRPPLCMVERCAT